MLSADDIVISGGDVVHGMDAALAAVEPGRATFIFGGASVYTQAMDWVDVIYATEVHGEFAGDAFFPAIAAEMWREVERQDFPADAQNAYHYSFVKYERITG